MKVILFCGGYGMRMHNSADDGMPKPMQMVGPRPLIWHVMRYYAHFGHKEFILCLGYGAAHIKNFFLTYEEAVSQDFTMCGGGVELTHFDIGDWSVTFVDTALESAIGERLRRVRRHLNGEESSGQLCRRADRRAFGRPDREVVQVRCRGLDDDRSPQSSFYCVEVSETGEVKEITLVSELPLCEPACRLRPRRRRLRHAGRAGQVVRLSARRILEARRHLQGTGRSRLPIPSWRATMDGLGARRRRIYAGRCRRGPMIPLSTGVLTEIAVVAAHCDDIAIRMGGTLLTLCRNGPGLRVRGLVLSGGDTEREAEELDALAAFCPGADAEVMVLDIPDGRAPAHWERIKTHLREFRGACTPDVVFGRDDAHQDHRLLAELLSTEFRDHLLLGYEVLKWEADKPMLPSRRRACRSSTTRRRRAATGSTSKRFSGCPVFARCSAGARTQKLSLWRRRR